MKMRFKRTGAILLACAMLCGTVPPYAGALFGTAITANAAVAGKGTKESPYIVNSYNELLSIISPTDSSDHSFSEAHETYVKLGDDIIESDEKNGRAFRLYSSTSNVWTIHLDLAGHTLSRTADTKDEYMIIVDSSCELVIDDSVGGGVLAADLDSVNNNAVITVASSSAKLTVNGGTINALKNRNQHCDTCITTYGGTTTINGGTFSSFKHIIFQQYGKVYVNGGKFIYKGEQKLDNRTYMGLKLNENAYVTNCELIGEKSDIFLNLGNYKVPLKNLIPENAVVTIDGKVVAHDDLMTEVPSVGYPLDGIIHGKSITIRSPKVIDKVNISITEPKAGQNISYSALTNDPENVNAWGVRNGMRQRGYVRAWLKGDTVLNGDIVNKFEAGNTYTAKFSIMTEQEGDTFSNDLEVTVNGKPVENLKIGSKSESASFSITYDLKKQKGDVTGDGKINTSDVTKVAAHVKGKKLLTKEQQALADIDGNGKVTITDLTKIAAHVKGKKMIQ